ncbi:hypothetical protein JOB18_038203 [Solea senegalensis]|uniref:Uncharacterized protein n=1 Tax=Solea senegalensis TaxID=28829 RepID=A0AAV6SER8_SOLSE|nr:hypothetical protein JOB18_038203 [Solea senegalensis]
MSPHSQTNSSFSRCQDLFYFRFLHVSSLIAHTWSQTFSPVVTVPRVFFSRVSCHFISSVKDFCSEDPGCFRAALANRIDAYGFVCAVLVLSHQDCTCNFQQSFFQRA